VYWILLSQDRVHWQTFMNTAMNLRIPSKARNFFKCLGHYGLLNKDCGHWPYSLIMVLIDYYIV
jgi:hypothetical protein